MFLDNIAPASRIAAVSISQSNSGTDRADHQALVIDCSNIQVLGTEVLSTLLLLQRNLKRQNARLVLCRLRAEVHKVITWTKLDRFFEIS